MVTCRAAGADLAYFTNDKMQQIVRRALRVMMFAILMLGADLLYSSFSFEVELLEDSLRWCWRVSICLYS